MDEFNNILHAVFKVPLEKISDVLTPKDIPEWDSMNYLFFISELEKKFGFSFTMDEVINAQTVGDVRAVVLKRGKNNG